MKKPKKPADPKKQLLALLPLFRNSGSALPILQTTFINEETVTVTDLETSVIFPFALPSVKVCMPTKDFIFVLKTFEQPTYAVDGDTLAISTLYETAHFAIEDSDNFPKVAKEAGATPVGRITGDVLADMITAATFVSNDDLRPAMTYVLLHSDVASTDAHRLFWKSMDAPFSEPLLIHRKVIRILHLLGGEWEVSRGETQIYFTGPTGIVVIQRYADYKFPSYGPVIPKEKEFTLTFRCSRAELNATLQKAAHFANPSTNQCVLKLGGGEAGITVKSEFEKEYRATLKGNWQGSLTIAFSVKFMLHILGHIRESEVKMSMISDSRAIVVNNHFLLMPLQLNSSL